MRSLRRLMCFLFGAVILCSAAFSFPVASLASSAKSVSNEDEFIGMFFDGGVYELTKDITISSPIKLNTNTDSGIFSENDITLDFNGFTVTCMGDSVLDIGDYGADITLKNSKDTGGFTAVSSGGSCPIKVGRIAKYPFLNSLVIDGGVFCGNACALSVGQYVTSDSVEIVSGVFKNMNFQMSPVDGDYILSGSIFIGDDGKTVTIKPSSGDDSGVSDASSELLGDFEKPQPSFIVEIPSVIDMEKVIKTDFNDPEKMKKFVFTVTAESIENFFSESKLQVKIEFNGILAKSGSQTDTVPYVIEKDNESLSSGDIYAEFFSTDDSQSAEVIIDSSQIPSEGRYSSIIDFIYTVEDV